MSSRRVARRRLVGPREQHYNKQIKLWKENCSYTQEKWHEYYSVFQNYGFFAIQHPYNSTIFDSVGNYSNYVHNMCRFLEKYWLKLGYETIESLIKHYKIVISHQESWMEKQDKKTKEKFKNYLNVHYIRLTELEKELSEQEESSE